MKAKEDLKALLCPQPQQMIWRDYSWRIPDKLSLFVDALTTECHVIVRRLISAWQAVGIAVECSAFAVRHNCRFSADITLQISPEIMSKSQSYRLVVENNGIMLIAADLSGLRYGVETLRQIIDIWCWYRADWGDVWPGCMIYDWPDLRDRGVMLDISRDKIPKMEALYALVEQLASWKINQLQLYMEHTFAYVGHEEVWRDADPMTGDQIIALDAYCRDFGIDLVPNQNSFGHMHHWLKHEKYRHLAECPDGIDHPFAFQREPYSLCPTDPSSLALIDDLYTQLLPHFHSRLFNVGLDETFDVGYGRSAARAKEIGTDNLYLEYLQQIYYLVAKHRRTMLFWADIILKQPQNIDKLPADGIALIWGYEAQHPFAEQCEAFANLGLGHCVCPGTSSWNSWAGRSTNAIQNLASAAEAAVHSKALGYLITDWGDFGHMQPTPISYLGFMAGANFSWNVTQTRHLEQIDWAALLDHHAFRDHAHIMGRLAYDLGDVYRLCGGSSFNASPLFRLLILAQRYPPSAINGLTADGLCRTIAAIQNIIEPLAQADMRCRDAELVASELSWCADIMQFACQFGIERIAAESEQISQIPAQQKQSMATQITELMERHQHNWLKRNRQGGLKDSLQKLADIHSKLME